jgi:hypothetical protein
MNTRPYLLISGVVFLLVALLHLVRVLNGWELQYGPLGGSHVGFMGRRCVPGDSLCVGVSAGRSNAVSMRPAVGIIALSRSTPRATSARPRDVISR